MTPIFLLSIPLFFAMLMPLFSLMKFIELRFVVLLFCLLLCLVPLSFLESVHTSGVLIQTISIFSSFKIVLTLGLFELTFITLFSFVAFIISLFALFNEKSSEREDMHHSIFFLLSLAGCFGILLCSNLGNLLFFYIFTNISLYKLSAYDNVSSCTRRIYLISNIISSVILCLIVMFFYIIFDSFDLYGLDQKVKDSDSPLIYLVALLSIFALLFKSEIYPINRWLPLLLSESSPHNTSFFVAISTKSYLIAILSILRAFFEYEIFCDAIIVVGATSMLLATRSALTQNSIRHSLAYLGTAQIGLIVMSFGYSLAHVNEGILFHLINHSLTLTLIYLAFSLLARHSHGDSRDSVRGVAFVAPIETLFFTLGAMSLMGFPPFSGFFSKLLLLKGFAEHGRFLPILLIFVVSLVEAVFYFRIIHSLYSNRPNRNARPFVPDTWVYVPLFILSLLVIYMGFVPEIIVSTIADGTSEFTSGKVLLPRGIEALR